MFLVLSFVLALIPLLGIVWVATQRSLTTVDGLFMSLILLAISGTLGTPALFGLKKRLSGHGATPGGSANAPRTTAGGGQMQRGKVEKVDFFEAHVGQPNKSIVSLFNGGAAPQTIVFEGDLRNALPAGQNVEITFRRASGASTGGLNVLLNVSYS
jgi:hypothetical protein